MWAIQHQMSLAIYLMYIALGLCQYPQTHHDEVLLLQQAKVKKQTNLEMNQKEKICKTGNLVHSKDKGQIPLKTCLRIWGAAIGCIGIMRACWGWGWIWLFPLCKNTFNCVKHHLYRISGQLCPWNFDVQFAGKCPHSRAWQIFHNLCNHVPNPDTLKPS